MLVKTPHIPPRKGSLLLRRLSLLQGESRDITPGQVNTLSNENTHLRQQLENEKIQCQQFVLQLETCNQTIFSLRAQIKD
ncbi:unnamed protein product [Caretta caretta]